MLLDGDGVCVGREPRGGDPDDRSGRNVRLADGAAGGIGRRGALEAVHERKIVHRHITPRSILWRASDKTVHLAEGVLAKALAGNLVDDITPAGQTVGDIPFIAPEQLDGSTRGVPRSDLYSHGVTVYALLTGRPPFVHSSLPEVARQIREDPPARPKQYQLAIADLFEGAVLRLLAKRPDDRYQSVTQLRADLQRVAKYQRVEL